MRYIPNDGAPGSSSLAFAPPVRLANAPNVFLETIKRGDLDVLSSSEGEFGKTSIVLRLYEAYGGHAKAYLLISKELSALIEAVYLTNILEDEVDDDAHGEGLGQLRLTNSINSSEKQCYIEFHGFQVRTVKIILKSSGAKR